MRDGKIVRVDENGTSDTHTENFVCCNCDGNYIMPGFTDVHVHFREPGFSYKETMRTGTMAAAAGGYTAVCTMPNLSPTPDSLAHLLPQLDAIKRDAVIEVHPYGALTVGERGETPAALEELAPYVVAFSDDGRGVQDEGMMRELMVRCAALGKTVAAHCEVNALLHGGVVHDGAYARVHGLPGISSASEWKMIERDLRLAEETGCDYHVCHISAKESVALIRDAKASGVHVTCETAPHYLTLCDADMLDEGRFKMNPPLRDSTDRDALLIGICDGTIDMIATDHAPHSAEEKQRGLRGSLMGIVGLETAFPILYTKLCLTGLVPLLRIVEMLTTVPARRFGLGQGELREGARADFAVWNLDDAYEIDPEQFMTMGRFTPFAGWTVRGKCVRTVVNGRTAYKTGEK